VRGPTIGAGHAVDPSSQASATCETVAPFASGDRPRLVDDLEVALDRAARRRLLELVGGVGHPRALRRRLVARVAAGQEAGAERAPRQHAEPGGAAEGQDLGLDRALDQRVLRLQRDERRPAVAVLQRDRPGEQPGREVGDPERATLPACTSPSSASSVASSGTSGSGAWIW
jgi:hypothetical protein